MIENIARRLSICSFTERLPVRAPLLQSTGSLRFNDIGCRRPGKRTDHLETRIATSIFVNLPVKDLKKSIAFFTRLGFSFNPRFTDDTATCMIVAENIFVMLLTHPKFAGFTPKPIVDATKGTEVLLCLSCENRNAVDDMVRMAVAAGGATYNEAQDHGFMYAHGFQDLDGHIWELVHMDPAATKQN